MDRREARRQGAATRADLGLGTGSDLARRIGLDDFLAEVVYAGIWGRSGLARPDRMLCALAALSLLQRRPSLDEMIAAALQEGVPARAICEVFVQAGLYGGFVTSEAALAVAAEIFDDRGIVLEPEPPRDDAVSALDERGRRLMVDLHGERSTGGYAAPGDPVTGALYPAAIRYGYGELWFRPGLTHRQRMLVALASFTVLGLEGQLAKFAQSAPSVGLTRAEIVEAVVQTGPYGGFPRALNGLAIASRVLGAPG